MALPPGPTTPYPIAAFRWMRNADTILADCFERFGDTFTLRFPNRGSLSGARVVVTCHPDTIKKVFTGSSELLHAGKAAQVLEPLVGRNSLLLLDGKQHLRQRRLMLPPFHGERMTEYVSAMRDETLIEIEALANDSELVLHPHLQQITLRVILRTVFGLEDEDEARALGEQLTALLDIATDPQLLLLGLLPVALGKRRTFERELKTADEMIYALIEKRRASKELDSRSDVLSMLLLARDESGEPMTDIELRDELVTLLVAGHETTATSLAWTVRLLLDHPAAHRRARAEVDTQLDREIDAVDLGRLPFLDAVLRESLRLRPVIPMVGRVLQVPMTFRGFRLPAGTAIAPSVWLTHHNPAIYHDPHAFVPERFEAGKPNPYAWLPFGGGVRRCLGQAFALVEMKVILATLLRHIEMEPANTEVVGIVRRSITFAPSDQTRILARRRAPRDAT